MVILRFYNLISFISMEGGITWSTHLFTCHCFHIYHLLLVVYRPGCSTVPWVEERVCWPPARSCHVAPDGASAASVPPPLRVRSGLVCSTRPQVHRRGARPSKTIVSNRALICSPGCSRAAARDTPTSKA